MRSARSLLRTRLAAALVATMVLAQGCATAVPVAVSGYDYFTAPESHDAWTPKIAGWQRREQAAIVELAVAPPPVADGGEEVEVAAVDGPVGVDSDAAALRVKYDDFRASRKRATAREFAEWIQAESKNHYVPDGPIDHWATMAETLETNGDDCDGLELLVFHALRDLGFEDEEVYRAIVHRPADGQHHMVTLWFEDRNDPWVIDPTGAMSSGMRRMSSIPGWVPLKVFSDSEEFTVRKNRIVRRSGALVADSR